MVCKNILVLGNGFDLHHNLKTKYSDFIQFMRDLNRGNERGINYKDNKVLLLDDIMGDTTKLREQTLQTYIDKGFSKEIIVKMWSMFENNFMKYFLLYNTEVNGWIDFEVLIKNITLDVENVINKVNDKIDNIGFRDEEKGTYGITGNARESLLAKSFNKIFYTDESGNIYVKEELINLTSVDIKAIIKILRREFDGLCDSLCLYLKDVEPYYREIKSEFTYQQIQNIRADAIITFNYTDTYKRYGIGSESAIHVHGSLQENNIVLGFNDDNEKELQYVYFKKYMQCILKHAPILDTYKFLRGVTNGNTSTYDQGKPIMHFFGHSLDVTDREKLEYLFNNASEIKIYYYDEDDHEDKIEKIIDLLGKQHALNQIYEKTIEFVQIEKTEEEIEKEEEELFRPYKIAAEEEKRKEEKEKEIKEMFNSFQRQYPEFFKSEF